MRRQRILLTSPDRLLEGRRQRILLTSPDRLLEGRRQWFMLPGLDRLKVEIIPTIREIPAARITFLPELAH